MTSIFSARRTPARQRSNYGDQNYNYLQAYHRLPGHGTPGARKLLLIHGNASSSVFYEPLMERLEGEFFMVAPDLRCFGGSDTLPVDATRGMRDFSDDIHELVEALAGTHFPYSAGPWAVALPCSTP